MPTPIQFDQARLIIDGVTYELADGHVMSVESVDRDEVRGYGGTLGRTMGRVSNRVTLDAEVLPGLRQPLTDHEIRQRIRQALLFPFDTVGGDELDQIAARHGIFRDSPAAKPPELPTPQPPAPEPRSRWDRLMDESLC